MSKPYKNVEIVNVTRRCFPKRQPISISADFNGSVTLQPGHLVVWREKGDTMYLLRNAHWFKRLTIHFVEPIKEKHNGH